MQAKRCQGKNINLHTSRREKEREREQERILRGRGSRESTACQGTPCCAARTLQCEILPTVTHAHTDTHTPRIADRTNRSRAGLHAEATLKCQTRLAFDFVMWLARRSAGLSSVSPAAPSCCLPPPSASPPASRTGDHFTNTPGYLHRKIINFLFCSSTVLLPYVACLLSRSVSLSVFLDSPPKVGHKIYDPQLLTFL